MNPTLNTQQLAPNQTSYLVFAGYFVYDSLNLAIKTSQICQNTIFQRKKRHRNLYFR